jgi:hypothetical protein
MDEADNGWAWFHFPTDAEVSRSEHAEQDRETSVLFARCFHSPEGRRVLDHLCAMTLHRTPGPYASEALLRHIEGQRQLVLYIQALVRKGSRG